MNIIIRTAWGHIIIQVMRLQQLNLNQHCVCVCVCVCVCAHIHVRAYMSREGDYIWN